MTLGRYIPGQSWMHQLDPRTKIACGLTLTVLVFQIDAPILLSGIVILLLFLPLITMLPLYITGKIQKPLLPLIAIIFFLNAGLTPGESIQALPNFLNWVTEDGLVRGSILALRLNAMVLLFAWMTITTSPSELSDSLERVLRPLNKLRLPTQDIVLALTVALRFVPIVFLEAERLNKAQLSRGAQFSGVQRLTRFVPILMPLFVATFTRAERLTHTLESRGYQHYPFRTQYHTLTFKRADLIAFMTVAGFVTYLLLNL